MAQLYHMTIDIRASPPPEKPSSIGSGLDEKAFSTSQDGLTPASEAPAAITATTATTTEAGNPGLERRRKVIVIGAGISGLRAASVLHRHGVDVVVLEGRDRIGGRIHTTRTPDGGVRDIGQSVLQTTNLCS